MNVKMVLVYLGAAIAIAAGGLAENFDFLPVGILTVSLVGAVISVLAGLFTKNYRAARFFGLLIVVSLLAMIVDLVVVDRERETAEKAAVQVIAAIERYQSAHGALPASLDQLVPEQLPKLPTARKGRNFWYHADSSDFSLNFSMPIMMVRTYDSKTKKWSSHD
jgi:hypothetical protein